MVTPSPALFDPSTRLENEKLGGERGEGEDQACKGVFVAFRVRPSRKFFVWDYPPTSNGHGRWML